MVQSVCTLLSLGQNSCHSLCLTAVLMPITHWSEWLGYLICLSLSGKNHQQNQIYHCRKLNRVTCLSSDRTLFGVGGYTRLCAHKTRLFLWYFGFMGRNQNISSGWRTWQLYVYFCYNGCTCGILYTCLVVALFNTCTKLYGNLKMIWLKCFEFYKLISERKKRNSDVSTFLHAVLIK